MVSMVSKIHSEINSFETDAMLDCDESTTQRKLTVINFE